MVHTFEQEGYRIALDVNSGAVHVLDAVSYALLPFAGEEMHETLPAEAAAALGKQFGREALAGAWDELYALHKDNRLFSKDIYEQYRGAAACSPIKSMCLNIAHDCNLRCRYCFASTGDFGGGRKLMAFETARRAIDFLIEQSGTRHNLEVDFFGGEPLMNFDVVKQVVRYTRGIEKAHDKNVRFTITTNGLLLDDDKIDFINAEMSNVVLSIDGRRAVNDRMRVRADGSGCYDDILPKFRRLCEKRKNQNYYVRGTFTRENLDFAADVMHLYESGFDQISVEPVIERPEIPYALREEDLPEIFAEYDKLTRQLIALRREGKFLNFFHFMIDLDHGPCAIKLLRGCGCGNDYVAVTPDGDIYPCHQFVGQEGFIMGNVNDSPITLQPEMRKSFANASIFSKENCRTCWARFFCSGGCNANNHTFNGDILKSFELSCKMEQKRVECAIVLKAALADRPEV